MDMNTGFVRRLGTALSWCTLLTITVVGLAIG